MVECQGCPLGERCLANFGGNGTPRCASKTNLESDIIVGAKVKEMEKNSPIISDYVRIILRECHKCGLDQPEYSYKTIIINSQTISELIVNDNYTVIGAEKTEDEKD